MLPQAPLMSAARLLADRGIYGLVWLEPDLVVRACFGRLVDFVEIGAPITDALWPLIGLEGDIYALSNEPGAVLNLPSVSLVRDEQPTPRFNIVILWSPMDGAYLLVASRSNTKADLEVELSQQIRARLMAEAEASRKSQELARINQDLEMFATIISHDLKSPLRMLRHLATDLESKLSPVLDETSRQTVERLKEQSNRMSRMMSALLEYSSIGQKAEALEEVDTRALVTAIVQSTQAPSGIVVEIIGDWPVIETLAAPLDLVLRNLFSNAIRHHDKETGSIRLKFEDTNSGYLLTVEDDGPGIARKHQEAIFFPFRRIVPDDADAGTGMGLSLIKRTLESLGGKITVQSDPLKSRGTSFCVTWPKVVGSHN